MKHERYSWYLVPCILAAIAVAACGNPVEVNAQPSIDANGYFVTGDGVGNAQEDWFVGLSSGTNPRLTIATVSASEAPFSILNAAPDGAVKIGADGVGIGFGSFSGSGNRLAEAPLHVVGGGSEDAYGVAQIRVEDRNPVVAFREMLRLSNSGGTSIRLIDTNTGGVIYRIANFDGRFEIADLTRSYVPFTAAPDAKLKIELAGNGMGLGTFAPTSKLHVFSNGSTPEAFSSTITSEVTSGAGTADRTALNLVNHGGTFMSFTDTSANSTWFFSNKNDELFLKKSGVGSPGLRFLATGEARFVNGGSNLLRILPTGSCQATSFVSLSDRNLKEAIVPVDPADVLDRVAKLPVSTWSYIKDEDGTRHMGPMAQDFHAAFGLGTDDKTIAEMDRSGVALAAIQGLNGLVQRQAGTIESQQDRIADLESRLERLEALIPGEGNLP